MTNQNVLKLQKALNVQGYRDKNGNKLAEDGLLGVNTTYVGDDYYPAIVDSDIFNKANNEIRRRALALGRIKEYKEPLPPTPQTQFKMGRQTKFFDDPFAQAEYMYSLIESEVD